MPDPARLFPGLTLSPTEQRFHQALQQGERLDLRTRDPTQDEPSNTADFCRADRAIRAEVVRQACIAAQHEGGRKSRGIHITAGWIVGRLDLAGESIAFPLTFQRCYFDARLQLAEANTRRIDLSGSLLSAGLQANGVKIAGSLVLARSKVRGSIRLRQAKLDNALECDGAEFRNPFDRALDATGLRARWVLLR